MQVDELSGRLAALIRPTVEAMGFDLVRARLSGGRARPVLQVMAERPDGAMSGADCAELSRALAALLDVEDPIAGAYELEVSSPGLDRPLTRPQDFERFEGYEAKLELVRARDGRRRFRGRLKGLKDGAVLLETTGQGPEPVIERLDFGDIAEARLVVSEEQIQASLKAGAAADKTGRARRPEQAERK
jgi:ribosome maturation factor RimP